MKKILALVLTFVMAFSLAAPALAAAPEIDREALSESFDQFGDEAFDAYDSAMDAKEKFDSDEVGEGVETAIETAGLFFKALHTFIDILADLFDFDCPFCGAPIPLYESAGAVIGEEFAGKDMYFKAPYPMNKDAAYVFKAPTKSIEFDGIATANIKTVVILEKGATTGKIVFSEKVTENYFHNVEGFKLIINKSGAPVNVVIDGALYWTNGDVIANIGDYIDGPYTLTVI